MARKLREEVEGGIHHVYARGNDRRRIFLGEADRRLYLSILGRVSLRVRWSCLAYCLMDNHVHLLVETRQGNLGLGMQRLQGDYARSFNDRRGGSGHVFQGRFGSTLIESDAQLLMVVRYIARNPAEAGLAHQMLDWRWSSHGVMLGGPGPPWLDAARLLSHLRGLGGDPLVRYRELIG
jgi:REP element-mobilizing transposase RayT